jgi:branched-chain amino acid transport system substrate-binding protein
LQRRDAQPRRTELIRRLAKLWILAAMLLAATTTGAVRAQSNPYEINAILSLTGPGAALGGEMQTSLKLVEKVVNDAGGVKGQPIHFVVYDDGTSPPVTVQLATALVQKRVPVILGPSASATCRAAAPLLETTGPLLYCFSPVLKPASEGYVYAVLMDSSDIAIAIMRFLGGEGLHRVAVIATTDASGQNGEIDARNAASQPENKGMSIVADEHFNPTDLNIAAQLSRISAAKPDAVLVFAPGTPFTTVLRSMRDVGMDLPTITSAANMVLTQVKQYDTYMPKRAYFQGFPCTVGIAENAGVRRAQQVLLDAVKRNGLQPDVNLCAAWDPAMIVVDALRHLGMAMTAMQLHGYIDNLSGWPGTIGVYDFRKVSHRGLSQNDVIVMRWDGTRDEFTLVGGLGGVPLRTERQSK